MGAISGQIERNSGLRNFINQQIQQRNVNDKQTHVVERKEVEVEADSDDFIFHLPAGMVDFNETFTQNNANRQEDDSLIEDNNQENIVNAVWANQEINNNPYSRSNFYYQQQSQQQTKASPMLQQIPMIKASPQQNMDLFYLQNMELLQQQQQAPPDDSEMDTIHSLMMKTNFVDSDSLFMTTLSPTQQSSILGDMRLDEEAQGTGNDESDPDAVDQKEIQRGPRFKHFGAHERRHPHK